MMGLLKYIVRYVAIAGYLKLQDTTVYYGNYLRPMAMCGQLLYPPFKISTAIEQAVRAQILICLLQERPEIHWIYAQTLNAHNVMQVYNTKLNP